MRKKDADPHHGLLDREKELLVVSDVPDHWPEQPPPPALTRVDSRTFQYMHFIRFVTGTVLSRYFSSLELELSKVH
jgi:hypothetical protein